MKVAVIGAGVMGEALIAGLIRSGIAPSSISIREKNDLRKNEIASKYGVSIEGVDDADIFLLLTKPQDLEAAVSELKAKSDALFITFAAGKRCKTIEDRLGSAARVVRVMPNTPLLLGSGISAVSAGSSATTADVAWIAKVLESSGKVVVVPEELQDAVTATSGSGPAYFFMMVEAMASAAEKLGMSSSDAMNLAKETLIGAALMLKESGKDAKTLRENVTSPNGTTAAALAVFDSSKWHEIVSEAMKAAKNRAMHISSNLE